MSRWLSGIMPRAVIDTSTLISAQRHAIWTLARDHYIYGIWNTFIVGDFPQGGSIAGVRYITPRDFFALLEVWYPDSPIASLTRSSVKRVP